MFEQLVSQIRQAQAKLTNDLAEWPNQDKYQYNCGRYQGMKEVLGIIDALLADEED